MIANLYGSWFPINILQEEDTENPLSSRRSEENETESHLHFVKDESDAQFLVWGI